jgi:hypothetical protein
MSADDSDDRLCQARALGAGAAAHASRSIAIDYGQEQGQVRPRDASGFLLAAEANTVKLQIVQALNLRRPTHVKVRSCRVPRA